MAGLLGGLVAAGAMSLAHTVIGAIASKPAPSAPNESAPQEEDATVKVATALARRVGYPLTEAGKPQAGTQAMADEDDTRRVC